MSSYHSSFKFLNKKSDEDFGWLIAHFDPDNGETDSYLTQEQVYSDSYRGTRRILYGTNYNSVLNVKITVIKQNGSEFSLSECRNAYKWLTGNPEASWMDLYVGDEVQCRLLCTIQDVKPQKLDARTVGLNIYCESLSPWAYSPIQIITKDFPGAGGLTIYNDTDDLYSFVYPKVTYENIDGQELFMRNDNTNEETKIDNVAVNEVITLHPNQFIISDNTNKTFGNTFNFVWPRLKPGDNSFSINAKGKLTFEYYWPIKIGDCAVTINAAGGNICDSNGDIVVDTLDWNRITNTPTTISEYGIKDVYTRDEIDALLSKNSGIYVQSDEPIDVPEYSLWVDIDGDD